MAYAYETALTHALSELYHARALLLDEIAEYPTPISGCDAQFNQLLSDRTRITKTIRALEEQPFVATPRMLEPVAATATGRN